MSFLKSFLGAAFAQAARDNKKKQEELDAWNALFDEASDMSLAFSDFLANLGINDSYVSPPASELATEGRTAVNAEKRKIENYKKKITEFINLGGHPSNIWYIEKIDDYIAKLKYMISIGYLEQQDDWLQTDMDMLKSLLDRDIKMKKIMQKAAAEEKEREQREAFAESIGFDIDKLSGIEFENVCQVLVEKMGFTTQTTKASGDGGIDLIAYNHQPLLSGKYIIQCKRYAGSVGEPIIRDLYGVVMSERANKGILMTTGHFTKSAISFAAGKPLELIDGPALKSLMNQYGLCVNNCDNQSFIDVVGDKDIVAVAKEMWERWDDEYEDEYYELIRLKKIADKTNDEIELAKYINWLLEKVDFDAFDICDHSQQIVFWNEINTYIKKFLENRTSSKSKLLSYLYQMKYVQNSILLERFTDAKAMFIEMMKDTGIQFNLFETMRETHNTDEIFENTGVFSFLFATWCNMYQMAFVSNDLALQEYLNDNRLFYGVPIMQNTRIEDNLKLIRSGKSGLNAQYFEKQQTLIEEISEWYACEPVQTKIFFRVENVDIVKSYFEYAYCNGETIDDLISFSSYTVEDGQIVIDNYVTIDLDNALRGYIPFSQTDLQ
mgnify:FL=1